MHPCSLYASGAFRARSRCGDADSTARIRVDGWSNESTLMSNSAHLCVLSTHSSHSPVTFPVGADVHFVINDDTGVQNATGGVTVAAGTSDSCKNSSSSSSGSSSTGAAAGAGSSSSRSSSSSSSASRTSSSSSSRLVSRVVSHLF